MLASLDECAIYEPAPAAFAFEQVASNSPPASGFSAFAGQPPPWLGAIQAKMEELGRLPDNWDSYGAKPIMSAARFAALNLLLQISSRRTPAPAIVPTADGSVQIEWHTRDIDLEVRVVGPTRVEVFFEDSRNQFEPIDGELQYDLRPLAKAMNILSSR